jgi:hypothetical protein
VNKLNQASQNPGVSNCDCIEDIRHLFSSPSNQAVLQSNMHAPWLDDIPEKAINGLPNFQGNNAASAVDHVAKLKSANFRIRGAKHLDVTMKLFSLSVEDDTVESFKSLSDNSFNASDTLEKAFLEKWGGA